MPFHLAYLQSRAALPRSLSLRPNRLIRRTLLNESCVRYALTVGFAERETLGAIALTALIPRFDSQSNAKAVSNRSPTRERRLF